jgi:glycosyltransferase involved in cell wall biosynthesis
MSETDSVLDLTFIVIAYNEERGIGSTVEEIRTMLRNIGRNAPILIMDDGSTDRTGEIADELAARYTDVDVFHQPHNAGQFRNIMDGVERVQTRYFSIIPGDNQFVMQSFEMFVQFIDQYDLVFGFPNNEYIRGRQRTFLSHAWRLYLLALFGTSITYLAGMVIAPAGLVRRMGSRTGRFLGWYETALRLALSGASYIQIPFIMREREYGETKALDPIRNCLDLFRMLRIWRRIKGPGVFRAGPDYAGLLQAYREYKADRDGEVDPSGQGPPQ